MRIWKIAAIAALGLTSFAADNVAPTKAELEEMYNTAYRAFDALTPEVDFPAELQKGNVAVAIFVAAIFISIALIIGKALG